LILRGGDEREIDMAARKQSKQRTGRPRAPVSESAFVVVLEDLRSQFKVFGESLDGVRTELKAEIGTVRSELAVIKGDLSLVKSAVLENSRELREIRVELGRKVDRDEVEGIVRRVVGA